MGRGQPRRACDPASDKPKSPDTTRGRKIGGRIVSVGERTKQRRTASTSYAHHMKRPRQPDLFELKPSLTEGFKYEAAFLSPEQELELIPLIEALPFEEFQFQGFVGKRRVVSFGWKYDFNDRKLQKADDMPQFLLPL